MNLFGGKQMKERLKRLKPKDIITVVLLAAIGIVTVLFVFNSLKGNTFNDCMIQEEGVTYSGTYYEMEQTALTLKDGSELELDFITYLPEHEELQFGFSLPESELLVNKEPFAMRLYSAETGKEVTKEPLYAFDIRDGQYHYRAILRDAKIDVEASEDLILELKSTTGELVYSEVFIRAETLFIEKDFSTLDDKLVIVISYNAPEE